MKKSMERVKWISLAIGILLILIGVLFYKRPMESLVTLTSIIAINFILIGILRLVRYFLDPLFTTGSFLITAIFDIFIGILIIYNSPVSIISLSILLGFWIMVTGIGEIAVSIDLKKVGMSNWWLGMLSGLIGMVAGIMLFKNPILSSVYIGLYTILYGLTFVWTFIELHNLIKRIEKR